MADLIIADRRIMGLNLRKSIVALAVLAALLGMYVMYTRLGGDAPVEVHGVPRPGPNDLADVPNERTGKIGETTIGPIHRTRLTHTDADGHTDRDFGFEDLYHSQGKQWEATSPFMTMYRSGFKCSVTADKGQVQIDSDLDRLIPNDAAFSGHVVIHIASTSEPNDAKEAFIYLNDVVFTAQKSLFSTSGPVKFVSRSAQLVGQGMELLYDEERGRLELFSVRQLDGLRLRSEVFRSLSDSSRGTRRGMQEPMKDQPQTEVVANGDKQRYSPNAASSERPQVRYECTFWKNVRITTPQQVIKARERLSITDIFWTGSEAGQAEGSKTPSLGTARRGAEPNESQSLPYPGPEALSTTGSNALALDSLPESFFDIVVTCKGGFAVRPMGTASPARVAQKSAGGEDASDSQVVDDPAREIIMAQSIDIDASTANAVLPGPVYMRLLVDPNGIVGLERVAQRIPVTVEAQKEVRFFSDSNRVVFDGNCVLTAIKTEPNVTTEYVLTEPKLTLDLVEDPNVNRKNAGATSLALGSAVKLRHATASGGPTTPGHSQVALRILQKTALGLIGGVELQGTQLDYDAQHNDFTAVGPGQIIFRNSQGTGTAGDSDDFSLHQPCYAFLRNFDRLTYSGATSRIVAESESKQLQIDYVRLVRGRPDRHIQADVGHIEAELAPAVDNRMELAWLTASEGIAYQEGDGVNQSQFDGSTLFYDHRKALMTIQGDDTTPCYFNGALVKEIEMNVKTRQTKAQIISLSTSTGGSK